jgi:hypothetical protein
MLLLPVLRQDRSRLLLQRKRNFAREFDCLQHSLHAFSHIILISLERHSPFDVIKTRQQMVGGNNCQIIENNNNNIVVEGTCGRQACAESIHQGRLPITATTTLPAANVTTTTTTTRNVGTFGYMQQIVQTEGLAGLWKGNVTRMVKIAPACAIMISCYELGKRVFDV